MRTRRLRPSDLDAVNEITIACNRDYASWAPPGWSPPGSAWESERGGWAEILGDPLAWGRVAVDGGRAVGVVAVDLPAEVRRLFVEPGEQGHGVGTRLLADAEAELRRRGRRAASLWTPAGSRAIRFYEGRGWQRDGRSGHHGRLGLDLIGMSKSLTAA